MDKPLNLQIARFLIIITVNLKPVFILVNSLLYCMIIIIISVLSHSHSVDCTELVNWIYSVNHPASDFSYNTGKQISIVYKTFLDFHWKYE